MVCPVDGLTCPEQPPPHISRHLEKLESTLRLELIPRFTGRPPPCDDERFLFAVPARLGGLGLRSPAKSANEDFQSSRMVSEGADLDEKQ